MSDHMTAMPLALVGSGSMAQAYAHVLAAQKRPYFVIGRGEASAARFREATGVDVYVGGVERWLDEHGQSPMTVIVAADASSLPAITQRLIESGSRRLLVEKPGSLHRVGLDWINQSARRTGAEVRIAFNRRFYGAALAAERMAAEDGGVTSFHFEFTEWSHRIEAAGRKPAELMGWFYGNSSHVIDLAFQLGGRPTDWQQWVGGNLAWHPLGSIFCGAGRSASGAFFSYHSNWQAPGRWSVELLTRKHRLHLRPMETLGVQKIGSLEIEPFPPGDRLDTEFKPGVYRQVAAFLDGVDDHRLPTLRSHMQFWDEVLARMVGPSTAAERLAA